MLVDPLKLQLAIVETVTVLSKNFTVGKAVVDVVCDEEFVNLKISNEEIVLATEVLEKFDEIAKAPSLFACEYVGDVLILSIGRFFVEKYNGTMTLSSNEKTGTVATISLPVHKSNF